MKLQYRFFVVFHSHISRLRRLRSFIPFLFSFFIAAILFAGRMTSSSHFHDHNLNHSHDHVHIHNHDHAHIHSHDQHPDHEPPSHDCGACVLGVTEHAYFDADLNLEFTGFDYKIFQTEYHLKSALALDVARAVTRQGKSTYPPPNPHSQPDTARAPPHIS